MEFAEVLRRRRMVRRFEPERPVDDAALERVLAAAARAPSAGFTQAVELLVLRSAAARDLFWHTQSRGDEPAGQWLTGMRTAPVLVVVTTSEAAYRARYAEADKAGGGGPGRGWTAPYWDVDAGMAAMAVLLAAVDEGLGACFFGLAGEDGAARLREAYGVPAERSLTGVVALGHPAEGTRDSGGRGSPARRPRRPAAELLHRERW